MIKTTELIDAIEAADRKREFINRTITIELVKEKNNYISDEMKRIVKKYGENLIAAKLSHKDRDIVKKYYEILNEVINQSMPMCKVIPQCKIKDIVKLKRDLVGFFSREADIDFLLKNSKSKDYFNTLYEGLRLDYHGSEFQMDDNYMGILFVTLPTFALRTPISKDLVDNGAAIRKIYIEEEPPYSGVGFIANELCIPEFYISISDKGVGSKKKNYGAFPQEAFCASLKIIQHNDIIIDFARYDAGDFECSPDDQFVIVENLKSFALDNGWI